jgi:hypothetical protein
MDRDEQENSFDLVGDEYKKMLLLDEMESLLEDMDEEEGESPSDWRKKLSHLGLANRDDLVARIAALHAELDRSEG